MSSLVVNINALQLSDQEFYQLCQQNRELRFERTRQGELIIMPPTGGETSHRNLEIAYQLQAWSRSNGLGIAFDSSGGFKLPNGADKSPDAAWIPLEKWTALSGAEQQGFVPLCPDFVIELRSPSDNLKTLQEKMAEYRDNGARLGWLINRQSREVEIYRQGQAPEIVRNPNFLSGEAVLPGFTLDLTPIW
ncbi:MAG: Uma2 family endonuclease [Cyanobacteriota bacterium]|nr:Uma2 family endonuclease [Cyanobacteriota bacterium]